LAKGQRYRHVGTAVLLNVGRGMCRKIFDRVRAGRHEPFRERSIWGKPSCARYGVSGHHCRLLF